MFAFGACGSKPSAGEGERSGEGGSGVSPDYDTPQHTHTYTSNEKMNADRNVLSSNGDHQKVRAQPCPVRCGVRRALCALEKGHREPA
jgi:hypothetical protein